jgi:hypothetical protein
MPKLNIREHEAVSEPLVIEDLGGRTYTIPYISQNALDEAVALGRKAQNDPKSSGFGVARQQLALLIAPDDSVRRSEIEAELAKVDDYRHLKVALDWVLEQVSDPLGKKAAAKADGK